MQLVFFSQKSIFKKKIHLLLNSKRPPTILAYLFCFHIHPASKQPIYDLIKSNSVRSSRNLEESVYAGISFMSLLFIRLPHTYAIQEYIE